MASVGVLLGLLGLVALSNSFECFFEELKVRDDNPPTGCVDRDGAEHEFRSKWVKDCMSCYCTHEGMNCCSMLPDTAVDIPEECEFVLDKNHCSAKLVLKSDKTQECTPT